jgi:hypothetical protein
MASKREELQSAVFTPIAQESALHETKNQKRDSVPDYILPLNYVRQFIEKEFSMEGSVTATCLDVVNTLIESFDDIYGPIFVLGKDVGNQEPEVFGWLYRLPEEFNDLLK